MNETQVEVKLIHEKVPNQQPKYASQPYRIAIIGEAPGKDEEYFGRPFVGMSGNLLWSEAGKAGIVRDACFVGNICQKRPPGNVIKEFAWDGPEITSGIEQLEADLKVFQPNLCVLLGASALRWAKGHPESILHWRGSLFISKQGYKCIASVHPAAVLREYKLKSDLNRDLRVARIEGQSTSLTLPERDLQIYLSIDRVIERLVEIREKNLTVAIDIEGYVHNMWCMSVATSPTDSFLIRYNTDDIRLWRAVAEFLYDPDVPKILQNACYDAVVLQYGHKMPVRGIVDDTMLMHWEMFCEKNKSLAYQASIYTRQPYYKDDRDNDDDTVKSAYCCLDSAVTYEIRDVLKDHLKGQSLVNYRFNLALYEPIMYMSQRGFNYDRLEARRMFDEASAEVHKMQWALNSIALDSPKRSRAEWVQVLAENCCFAKAQGSIKEVGDLFNHSKKDHIHNIIRATEILRFKESLSCSDEGELSMLAGIDLNVESPQQIANFLYRGLGLPVQYKKEGNKLTDRETVDVLALLTLYKKVQNPVLKLILKIRARRDQLITLNAKTDPDGRIRCSYNQLKREKGTGGLTATGRLSCSTFLTGSGYNLQTTTKKQRKLFIADKGFFLFQCDLRGADGWTVAAHCNACSDPTMIDDYKFSLKPANIIALMFNKHPVNKMTRQDIKSLEQSIDKDGWLYFACKRVQHGTNYGMKAKTMSDQILKDSYKLFGEPVVVPESTCEYLQLLYLQRYPGILTWHSRIKQQLKSNGYIISASGHKRQFFGRKEDYDTFKDACAEEPQNNTAYATNLAITNLWADDANRNLSGIEQCTTRHRCLLRIQPLHQMHDALIGQFRQEEATWASEKIRGYFDNPITIAGQQITIPFEGAYGPSWGELIHLI